MTLSRLGLAFGMLLVSGLLAQGDDGKKEPAGLKGTWELVEMVVDGRAVPMDRNKPIKIVFDGEKMTISGDQEKKGFSYKADATKTPKQIDVTPLDGPFKGKTNPGIYEIEGDTLKLAIPNRETKDRPTEFKSEQGANLALMTLKRAK